MSDKDKEIMESLEIIGRVREAILNHIELFKVYSGQIDCPVCGGIVSFRQAQCNGHIHAKCTTDNCANWME